MQHYHPIRIALVERLEAQRKEANVAALQAEMLARLSKKATTVREIKKDHSLIDRQREGEGFDAESSAQWRLDIIEELKRARSGFEQIGKNIYDISRVCPLFREVDVDDIVLDDTPLPHASLYLHFGSSAGLSLGEDLWIDGAYLRHIAEKEKELCLTFVCNHPGWKSTADVPLGQTFKRNSTAACLHISREQSIAWSIENRRFSGAPSLLEANETLVEALRMAINGLLYLNLARAELDFGYPPDAPKELVFSATNGSSDKRMSSARKLDNLGYIKVNFAGRSMVAYVNQHPGDDRSSGRHRATHWRRGHWRRVVIGEGRRNREWRLFEGTIVNGSTEPPADTGKIHIVKPVGQTGGPSR
ncbi:hypothetical protein [Rhizobium sp. BK176]|uniref:hypothetical protein n=1 Tax=Rhizobium sp. BK176 TaxID=2587071 RepID=UPI002168A0CD|nr:hypothetical protein [Rhizobium sp. BK176]MCS4089351.1 hypothetical protein [Rhizobium sp. BK176]